MKNTLMTHSLNYVEMNESFDTLWSLMSHNKMEILRDEPRHSYRKFDACCLKKFDAYNSLVHGHELLEKKIYDNLHVFGCPIFYHVIDSKLEKKKKTQY